MNRIDVLILYPGRRAAPQTPLLFFIFGTVGGQAYKYIVACRNKIDVLNLIYWARIYPNLRAVVIPGPYSP